MRQKNNIVTYDTKQPLLLFLIELEPSKNNKEIYEVKKLLNTIITSPRELKEIYRNAHAVKLMNTKNYCFETPACVKYAVKHLTANCPLTGKTV